MGAPPLRRLKLLGAAAKGTHLPDFAQQISALPDKYLSLGSHLSDTVPNPFSGIINNTTGLAAKNTTLGQLLLPYPQYVGYSIGASGWSDSVYHSLQAKVEKRMRGAGTLLVSYTISKMITTGDIDTLTGWLESTPGAGIQDWNNRKNERSLSSYDVPQRLVVSYVVDLPVGHGKRFLSTASRSGSPESRLKEWFDTSAFSVPAPYTFGIESRVDPVLRSQGIQNWDFSLFKDTRFGPEDRLGVQFRAEFFNLFNKPQFGPPNTTTNGGGFGVVSSTLNNPRLIQFALRFTF